MNRFLRIFTWVLGGLVLILALAVVVVPMVFDPNDYRDEIADLVKAKTGRNLAISGDLDVSVFPWLGINIGRVALSNAEGFGQEDFARIESAQLRVKLVPLFSRKVEMDTLIIKGLRAHLAVDASGRNNWSDMNSQAGTAEPAKAAASGAGEQGNPIAALGGLAIGGVMIQDGQVTWRDASQNQSFAMNQVNLETGPIDLLAPVPVKLSMLVTGERPRLSSRIDLTGRVTLSLADQQYTVQGLNLHVEGKLPESALTSTLTLGGDLGADLARQRYRVDGLKVDGHAAGGPIPGGGIDMALTGQLAADMLAGTTDLKGFNLKLAGVAVAVEARITGLTAEPKATGTVKVAPFSPADLLGRLSITLPERADRKTLSRADLELSFAADKRAADLTGIQLHLDDSTLTGRLRMRDYTRPALRFGLGLDRIDVDRYLPPPERKGAPVVATPVVAGAAAGSQLPLPMLRQLDLDGKLKVDSLKAMNLSMNGVHADIRAKHGVILFKPGVDQFYKGAYRGEIRLDVRKDIPGIAMNERLKGVQFEPLIKDFLGKDIVFGRGDATATLKTRGLDPDQATAALGGKVSVIIRDGGVKGVDLVRMIRSSGLTKAQDLSPGALDQTAFTQLSASAVITDGVLRTQDLLVDSAQVDINGSGLVNLVKRSQQLRLLATPQKELAKLLGGGKTAIPVDISGTFAKPRFRVDIESILKAKADAEIRKARAKAKARIKAQAEREKAKAQERIDRERKKLEQKARDALKNKLKGLFN